MNFVKISKRLVDYYGCDQIWLDFLAIPDMIVVHRIRFIDGQMYRAMTSYSYEDFDKIMSCEQDLNSVNT